MLDLRFSSQAPVELRRLEVEAAGRRLEFDGGLSLPQSLRLLVDARPLTVATLGVDLAGGAHERAAEVRLSAGETRTLEVDLTEVRWCPAPPPPVGDRVLFDEAVSGTAFGYDRARLAERADEALACSGARVLEYSARGRYDGFGIIMSEPRPAARLELRLRSSPASAWLVGLGDGPTWVTDGPVLAEAEWRSVSLDVPAELPSTARLVFQLESPAPAVLHVDDVRLTPRE